VSALNLKKLTVIIAGSFCLWNIDITSANAFQITFTFVNRTTKIATDFHIKYKLGDEIVEEVLDANTPLKFSPLEIGGHYNYTFPENVNYEDYISAEWSFGEGIKNEPVAILIPEPTTIFGSALALGVGGWLKRKKSSQQNKITSHH
jgi:hypothetical protein